MLLTNTKHNWKPPRLSELTQIISYMKLTDLRGSEASNRYEAYILLRNKKSILLQIRNTKFKFIADSCLILTSFVRGKKITSRSLSINRNATVFNEFVGNDINDNIFLCYHYPTTLYKHPCFEY